MEDNLVTARITSLETAIFICPLCKIPKTTNVSRFLKSHKPIRLKVTCSCGNEYVAMLDRRKKYRKTTNLPGKYSIVSDEKNNHHEIMTVCDISHTGMKLKINRDKPIAIGTILKVQFRLDDSHRSLIERKVKVVSVNESDLGTKFLQTEDIGKELGFYLFT